jgi:glycosyltransferase involved in cell wall biosynthesis
MLCGTPVIAFNKGSMPELIQHQKNGFLVNNVLEAVNTVAQLNEIDRNFCYQSAKDKFSTQNMANGYLALYQQILEK